MPSKRCHSMLKIPPAIHSTRMNLKPSSRRSSPSATRSDSEQKNKSKEVGTGDRPYKEKWQAPVTVESITLRTTTTTSKFPSSAARDTFAQEFEKYHNSHEHDGDVPRFEMIKAVKIKSYERQAQGANDVTMDGYSWAEIHKYHNREFPDTHTHYRVPTCCLSPIIVLDREFIDSGTLQRHELSSIFGDMPDDDFANLMKSVETDGFMDPLIRMHEGADFGRLASV